MRLVQRVQWTLLAAMAGVGVNCGEAGSQLQERPLTAMAIAADVDGIDLQLTEAELLNLVGARLAAEGVNTDIEIPQFPADEETPPLLRVWIRTGPQVCREYYPLDTGHCDRVGFEFREPARLIRAPAVIVMATTVQFSEGSDYRGSPEVYASEIQPERLRERVLEKLEWLLEEIKKTKAPGG